MIDIILDKQKKKESSIEQPIAPNDKVVLIKTAPSPFANGGYIDALIENEEILNVDNTSTYNGTKYANLVTTSNVSVAYPFYSLRHATKEEIEGYEEKKRKQVEKLYKELETIHVPYTKRVIKNTNTLNALSTGHNIADLVTWDFKKSEIVKGSGTQPNYLAGCCAFTKCHSDVLVYIPKLWLHYYGYSALDLERWLKFLSNCDFEFEYDYLGLGEHPKFSQRVGANSKPMLLIPSNEFYKVVIKGSKTNNMLTYMKFITVRYLYNIAYWNIPATALQIKFALKDKITSFQALMFAHLREGYNGYYALCGNQSNYHADPFQDVKNVISAINGGNMNSSFLYLNDLSQSTLNNFFNKKDYEGLYEYVLESSKKRKY